MDFDEFKQLVLKQQGLDLAAYKEHQLLRRIGSLMSYLGISDYRRYLQLLNSSSAEWRRFIDKVTINVTEFFRNPEIFTYLQREILPSMASRHKRLKIWSAACANGAEAYSLAMLSEELGFRGRYSVEGTDIDEGVLEQARLGRYSASQMQGVSAELVAKYFRCEGKVWEVKTELRRSVSFYRHDLLRDTYPNGYTLIVCRNVTIYFTQEAQLRIHKGLCQALSPGGVLFIGATETILQYREIGLEKLSPWFYRRPPEA